MINFISLKQKKISYMKKEENEQERQYQSYNRYRRKSNRIYQSQSEWNIERCIKLQIMIQLILNLTGKVLVKTSGN